MDNLGKVEKKLDEVGRDNDKVLDLYKEIMSDQKKANKRMFIVAIILLIFLFATNLVWITYEMSFETIVEHTLVEGGEGTTTYLRDSERGDISYGENYNNNQN